MNRPTPELLAPAGSFMAAYYALQAGADAVYLGLTEFSARQSAQNFSETELLKIIQLARGSGKKIYVALNTIILEKELASMVHKLIFLRSAGIDAILVQDLGVLYLIRKNFPDLALHASTQMAVHNRAGVEAARRFGVRRIVLPREMTLKEVRTLIRLFPDLEFEVFIHGALCFSYSGLCLASGLARGNSGNRGRCAQLCRLCYQKEGVKGYFLSCRDLWLGSAVAKLRAAGVHSLKIEGRQKPPEYVYYVVRLYRYLLDSGKNFSRAEYRRLADDSRLVFSREISKGRILGNVRRSLIDSTYPRHKGLAIGRVRKASSGSFSFKTTSALTVSDALLFYLGPKDRLPYKLPVKELSLNGIKVKRAESGTLVTVCSEKVPPRGTPVYKLYAKDLELPGIQHKGFKAPRLPVGAALRFFTVQGNICLEVKTVLFAKQRTFTFPLVTGPAPTGERLADYLESGFNHEESPFILSIGNIHNDSGQAQEQLFISKAVLKRLGEYILQEILRDWQEDGHAQELQINAAARQSCRAGGETPLMPRLMEFIADRQNLNPSHGAVPFYTGGNLNFRELAGFDNNVFLPLTPVVPDQRLRSYFRQVKNLIKSHPHKKIWLGINNLHHFYMLRKWLAYPQVFCFIDIFLYAANASMLDFCRANINQLVFAYFWIEGSREDFENLSSLSALPLIRVKDDFPAPVFLHRGYCGNFRLKTPDLQYRLFARGEWTWVIRENRADKKLVD